MTGHEGAVEKKVLEAAKSLFASKGHEETTLREIAAKARTSESQIVKYFQSKAGILDALFGRARAYIDEPLKKLCEETEDSLLILEKVPNIFINFYKKDPELITIYLFSRRFYTLVSVEELMYGAEFRKHLAGLFIKGQKEKLFRDDFDSEAAASALWGAIQGMMRDKFYADKVSGFPNFSFEDMTVILREVMLSFARGE